MRHSQYTAISRGLAMRHPDIRHSEEQLRFLRILISSDPLQKQLDLSEFYNSLRNRLDLSDGSAAMISENYQADYDDNHGEFYAKYHHSAFLVLKYIDTSDYDARDKAIDATERIGEELMGAFIYELEQLGLVITPADVMQEAVGPIAGGFVGTRFNFMFRSSATQALTYNPDAFLPA
ncbi:hypothetical protein [Hymenobacter crusticola]|uniref:Uncharacterized protein n=1 Tax=Hymenobacter crusticola TaxID=1770526 RepID=A0A243W5K5_9BACT|nr:hypothetical protein [Hymenobacter crusticola]OUJ68808.1 hypothetical protein BXP70_27310 [Hymenobacter crusticola]